MELGQAKKLFLLAKRSEHVTGRTLETYEDDLKRFYDYLFCRNICVSEVDSNCIREFLVSLQEKGLKGITQHRYFRELLTLFIFLNQNDY